MRNRFYTSINNVEMNASASTTFNSASTPTFQGWMVTMQVINDGGSSGTYLLEVSNDQPANLLTDANGNKIPVNWNAVSSLNVSGTGTVYMGPQQIACNYIRTSASGISGTGFVTCEMVIHDSYGV